MATVAIAVGAVVATAAGAGAQDAPRERRTCRVGRVAEAAAPNIDGLLDDACWTDAEPIGDLVMLEPSAGGPPTQRTVVKLLHDRGRLYIGIWCFDDRPTTIRARERERDAQLDPDDRVEILLDPFENRRTAYFFQIGAGGSIGDGLSSQNGSRFDKPWDTVFDGRARVTERGWQAELSIPFRSIPRRAGATSWGFNLRRIVRSTGEESVFANASQSVSFFRTSEFGTITGFGAIDDGLGIELVPYAAAGFRRDRSAADRGAEFEPAGGADLFYRLTPELMLAATAFTDFAETESDSRQINLGRFPLFFPEKRDFFLQGAGNFAFGAQSFATPSVLPFFSRRIGLDRAGNVVPVLAGIKLTGEAGPLELGVLAVATDPAGGRAADELAVARLRYSLAEQTAVGVIATTGDPETGGDSQTGGIDLYHRVPQWFGDLDLQLFGSVLFAQRAGGGGDGQDLVFEARSRGREWDLGLAGRRTSAEFDPALGFVRRRGVEQWTLSPTWSPRLAGDGAWRTLSCEAEVRYLEAYAPDRSGTDEFAVAVEFAGLESHQGDRIGVTAQRQYERVPQSFTLFDGTATIAAGEYWTSRSGFVLGSSDGRDLSASGRATFGDFYDGRSAELSIECALRASAFVHFGLDYETASVDLSTSRDFTTRIGEARVELHPSPRLAVHNLVQFDNESRVLGWQARLRWITAPGNDFFAVLGTTWDRAADGSLVPAQQSLTFKLQQTFRF